MGINTIDCNLIIKVCYMHVPVPVHQKTVFSNAFQGEDLDSSPGVLDLTSYLRQTTAPPIHTSEETSDKDGDMKKALDQKNYIEELNRRLM